MNPVTLKPLQNYSSRNMLKTCIKQKVHYSVSLSAKFPSNWSQPLNLLFNIFVGEHSSNPKISPTQSRGLWYSTSRVSILSLSTRLRINSSYGFNSVLKWKLLSVCSGSLGCEVVPGKVDVDMYCEPSRMFEAWSYISGKYAGVRF